MPRPYLSWLKPVSPGGLSPMQLLLIWLSRHYSSYANSNAKVEMLEELCQGMRDTGYPGCTIPALRSKIDSLRRETRRERIGDHHHSRVFLRYQEPLMNIFANEGQHDDTSDTEISDEDENTNRDTPSGHLSDPHEGKSDLAAQDGTRNAPIVITEADESETHEASADFHSETRRQVSNLSPDLPEIRRRFVLLCARRGLEQRDVSMQIINRMLPLPED